MIHDHEHALLLLHGPSIVYHYWNRFILFQLLPFYSFFLMPYLSTPCENPCPLSPAGLNAK